MERTYFLNKMIPKKEGRGEDSDPILLPNENFIFPTDNIIVLGVFDGMGGAGGAEWDSDFTEDGQFKTKAYIGSRIVRNAIEKAIMDDPSIVLLKEFSDKLKKVIIERYASEKEKYPPKSKGGLRSALIKEYPTTLAITIIIQEENEYYIDSYWAGDSRNFIWNTDGLFQISIDDLKGNPDPLQNLHEDAPMSNCVQADAPFKINHKRIPLSSKSKFVAISATDGCFGYYPSPMDFEKSLIDTLHNSNSIEEWEGNLIKAFSFVTGDDFSFSIAAVGFKSFNELKSYLGSPNKLIKSYYAKRTHFEQEVRKADEKIAKLKKSVDASLNWLWPQYKETYLKYMTEDEER